MSTRQIHHKDDIGEIFIMAKKPETPRELMLMAIDAMRQSVSEPRDDGKASPKVGAALLKPDGSIDTAYRGELREGDHAEFTLLEKKNRASILDDSMLFATLEPCAPGARNSPKLGCAERIVLARIKKVWVGIEDPDPTVDRKGIAYLQKNGVDVQMFDRDLQEVIKEENKDFLDQAQQRAEGAAEVGNEPIILSSLEKSSDTTLRELSSEALNAYRTIAKIDPQVDSPEFERRLARLGILEEKDSHLVPTGFGLLLFGKEPRTAMQQAGLLATIQYPDIGEEVENFEGPQVGVPQEAMDWLRDKLPNVIIRSDSRRQSKSNQLLELIREGIVNALVHRNYDIQGAKCQMVVTPDKIVIMSPGKPVVPITLEQMQAFNAPMLSRNPVLHYIFAAMEMAEERGLGLKSMRTRASEIGLPIPRYTWEDPYLVLTLYLNPTGATLDLPARILEDLNPEELRGYQFITTREAVSSREYADAMQYDSRKAQRHLKHFVDVGLLQAEGAGPSIRYRRISS